MVEDTPDDLVHELFTKHFWEGHPLARPILGSPATVEGFTQTDLHEFFRDAYVAPNVVVAAAGNLDHDRVRDLVHEAFGELPVTGRQVAWRPPTVTPKLQVRNKELEQSHICLGTIAYQQAHDDRYVSYVLNTLFGGSMSSRLFQNVREKRGLAYAVFSGLNAYRDAGSLTVYAGCATSAVEEVIDVVIEELRGVAEQPVFDLELRRAQDHLKGSLMLSLENTASRMSHLARQEIYFGRQVSMDETLAGVEAVSVADVQRVGQELFKHTPLSATILGPAAGLALSPDRLGLSAPTLVE